MRLVAPENELRKSEQAAHAVLRWAKVMERFVNAFARWVTLFAGCTVALLTSCLFFVAPAGIAWGTVLVFAKLMPLYALGAGALLAARWVEGAYFPWVPWVLACFGNMKGADQQGFGRNFPRWPHHGGGWIRQVRLMLFVLDLVEEPGVDRSEFMKAFRWDFLWRGLWTLLAAMSVALVAFVHLYTVEHLLAHTWPRGLPYSLPVAQMALVVAVTYWVGWSSVVRPALERRAGASIAQALQQDGYRRSFFWGWRRNR